MQMEEEADSHGRDHMHLRLGDSSGGVLYVSGSEYSVYVMVVFPYMATGRNMNKNSIFKKNIHKYI